MNMLKASCWVRVSFHNQLVTIASRVLLCLFLTLHTPLSQVQGQENVCDYSQPKMCGNLSIPYPFGMSPECGRQEFRISCKPNASYGDGDHAFLQLGTPSTPELQVLNFSTSTLLVNSTQLKAMPQDCQSHSDVYGHAALELPEDGNFILAEDNWFVVIGCNANGTCNATTREQGSYDLYCTTSCFNQFDMPFCNYYACCVSVIPPGTWILDLYGKGINYADFPDVCGFSTVLTPSSFHATAAGVFGSGHYGLLLSWALKPDENCSVMTEHACHENAKCNDGKKYGDQNFGYTCNCTQGYRGDGYKAGIGCVDIDECKEGTNDCEMPPLGMCINTDGNYECRCATTAEGSGKPGACPIPDQGFFSTTGGIAIIVVAVVVFIVFCVILFWYFRRKYQKHKIKKDNLNRIRIDELRPFLFSQNELEKATKGFADDHVLGEGGFGKVYWGKIRRNQEDMKVAIKRAKPSEAVEVQLAQMQSFVKEILHLRECTHRSVVHFLGCCMETSVPLLVFEYVEKGTLRDYLETPGRDACFGGRLVRFDGKLMWAWRLHVAVETAEAIAYLHQKAEPIFHLDMKSANILIDRRYNPKVADFGLSCFLTADATHVTKLAEGTLGYVDPEYCQNWRVTDKCDVYSFGVVLLELISGKRASHGQDGPLLAHQFREEIVNQKNFRSSFIDVRLGTDCSVLESIQSVVELAHRCVALRGSDRPSIQEVVQQLKKIQQTDPVYLQGRVADHDQHIIAGGQELYGHVNSAKDRAAPPDSSGSFSNAPYGPPSVDSEYTPAVAQFPSIELGQLLHGR